MTTRSARFVALMMTGSAWLPVDARGDVPGYLVVEYAAATDPVSITFGAGGDLYLGRDLSGSGGSPAAATRIWRVTNGGATVVEYAQAIDDPDSVFFDVLGAYSGIAGSVIVGGRVVGLLEGRLTRIAPDESLMPLHQSAAWSNPTYFREDGSGRLLFGQFDAPGGIWQVTGAAAPALLFSLPASPSSLTVDRAGQVIYTFGDDGVIRAHDLSGTQVNGSVATFGGLGAIALGPGGPDFPRELHALVRSTGELFRVDGQGSVTSLGDGFVMATDLDFGPDGAMYIVEFGLDRVLRIARAISDLEVSITEELDPVPVGGQVIWYARITNAGPDPADATALDVAAPTPNIATFATVVPTVGSCAPAGVRYRCDLGTLGVGMTATVTITLDTSQAGLLTGTASVSSAGRDPGAANDVATIDTRVGDPPPVDAGLGDASEPDAAELDAMLPDAAELPDASPPDMGMVPADAGQTADSGVSRDAGDAGQPDTMEESGCGCRASARSREPTTFAWVLVTALGLLAGRSLTRRVIR